VFGIGLLVACSLALEQRGEYGRNKVIGCVSATLAGSLFQAIASLIFFFKVSVHYYSGLCWIAFPI